MAKGFNRSDANTQFLDRYSIPHAAVGSLFELSGVNTPLALGSHVVFELIENQLKRASIDAWPDARPDAWQNHLGDFLSFSAGYFASRALKPSEGGKLAITALVTTAAAIWAWNLANKHSWPR